jgi:anti-anti-sigma factor
MVNFNMDGENLTLTFPKKIDTALCATFEAELLEKIKTGSPEVQFNLAGVEYIASSFLRICLELAKQIGTERFTLINVPPFVQKVFKVAGLDGQLTIK